jgi:hypothetical protein
MRLPRVRFTIRTLLLCVVAMTCSMGDLGRLWRRSADCRRLATLHQSAAQVLSEEGGLGCMDNGASDELFEPALRRAFLYHRSLARAYFQAARRPWLAVPSDAPPAGAYPQCLVEALNATPVSE